MESPAATMASNTQTTPVVTSSQDPKTVVPSLALPVPVKPKESTIYIQGSKKPKDKTTDPVQSMLITKKSKRDLVRMALARRYGHPALINSRLRVRDITVEQLEKDKKSKKPRFPTQPGAHFFESTYYFVSAKKPADITLAGIREYAFSDIDVSGGDYIFIAATDAMMLAFMEHLVKFMRVKFSGQLQHGHTIKRDIISGMLETTNDPFINFARTFFAKWEKEVPSESSTISVYTTVKDEKGEIVKDDEGKVKKDKSKREVQRLVPRPVRWQDAEPLLTQKEKDIIAGILVERTKIRKARGEKLYAAHGITPSARAATKERKKERDEETVALEQYRNKDSLDGKKKKGPKVTDFTFNLSTQLTHNGYVRKLIEKIKKEQVLMGLTVSEDANRFVNDLFNEIIYILCNIGARFISVGGGVTLKTEIAIAAVESFIDSVYGDAISDFRKSVLDNAKQMKNRWESKKAEKAKKRKDALAKKGEASEEETPVPVPVPAPVPAPSTKAAIDPAPAVVKVDPTPAPTLTPEPTPKPEPSPAPSTLNIEDGEEEVEADQ